MAYSIEHATQTIAEASKYKCNPCSFDEQTVEAIGFCVVCIEYLCKECLKNHRKNKATRCHNVLIGDTIPANVKSFQLLAQTAACKQHPDREVEYICQDHDEYICVACVGRNHRKCERVEEIVDVLDEKNDKERLKQLQAKLLNLRKKILSLRQRKEQNVESLHNEGLDFAERSKLYIVQIQDLLNALGEQSKRETELVVQENINIIRTHIENSVLIENEQLQHFNLLKTTLEYGSLKQMKVVVNGMAKKVDYFQEHVDEYGKQNHLSVTFKPNVALLDISAIGTVKTIKMSPKEELERGSNVEEEMAITNEHSATKVVEKQNELRKVQPNLIEDSAEKNKTEDDKSVSSTSNYRRNSPKRNSSEFMKQKIEPDGIYNVKDSDDVNGCSIYGCVFLSNGRLVLIDNQNKKIKMYDKNLTLLFVLRLSYAPFAICCVSDSTLALTYSNYKRIDRYAIRNNCVKQDGGFLTRMYGRGISTHDSVSNIAVVMVELDGTELYRQSSTFVIEIRNIRDGKVIKIIDTFQEIHGKTLTIKEPCYLLSRSNCIILGEQRQLRCFDHEGICHQVFYNVSKINLSMIYSDSRSIRKGTCIRVVFEMVTYTRFVQVTFQRVDKS